ncbi:MAG: hypothetical protein ACOC7U_00440 [Spirochaetota bacterium]
MGLEDRDYMKAGFDDRDTRPRKPALYKRVLFLLWRIKRALFKTA